LHFSLSAIPEGIISEVTTHSLFDIKAEPQETVPFAPIDNPPPSSLADRLRALKRKTGPCTPGRHQHTSTNHNNNNNSDVQNAQISGTEGLVCFLQ
jgi:hypothetical protein